MIYLAIILYILGIPLGAAPSIDLKQETWRVWLCGLLWPITASAVFAGIFVGYLQARKFF